MRLRLSPSQSASFATSLLTVSLLAILLPPHSNASILIAIQAAQPTPAPINFEVVSIKPSAPDCKLDMLGPSDDGFHLHCMTLQLFVQYAYNLNPFVDGHVLGLPSWGATAHFDLDAPVEGKDRARFQALMSPEAGQLLRPALAERFALRLHEDKREMPVYALVPGKSAPKLKSTDPSDSVSASKPTLRRRGKDHIEAFHCTIQDLADFLSPLRGRPVIDRTNLTGSYDFNLAFTPETNNQPSPDDDAAPSIFTALQEQLGLRLIPDKGPQPVVVIDAASQPSAN